MINSPLLISATVRPRRERERDELLEALARLAAGDAGLRVTEGEGGGALLEASSERRLEEALKRFAALSPIEAEIGAARVSYRERLAQRQEIDFTHRRPGQFARVKLVFEPNAAGGGNLFANRADAAAVPSEFVDGVERGVASVVEDGAHFGRPIVELGATLVDGACHSDSSVLAFEIAARAATQEALAKAGEALEPIMAIEATTPEELASAVAEDLRRRRGDVGKIEKGGEAMVVVAAAPLAELLGYGQALRDLTGGRAELVMRFSHYAPATEARASAAA